MKYKSFKINLKAVDDDQGIVTGYASTFGNTDREGDIFEMGAFGKSLEKLRQKNLKVPMLASHDNREVIGGFDPNNLIEDAKGLRVEGQLDLATQKGREFFSLAKKGFINSFSIGFSTEETDDFERISTGVKFLNVSLFEISLVPVPANPEALINGTKDVGAARNLPLAPDDTKWDSDAADGRVRQFTKSDDAPSASYRKAFMFFDGENSDNFTAYKLPFADVDGGSLKAVPRALSAIVAVLNGGRGGVDIPSADRTRIKGVVNGYFKKMGRDEPFGDDSKSLELNLLNLLIKVKRINV